MRSIYGLCELLGVGTEVVDASSRVNECCMYLEHDSPLLLSSALRCLPHRANAGHDGIS